MLIGASRKRDKDDFFVKNLFEQNSTTWFGGIIVPFEISDFFSKKIDNKAENKTAKQTTVYVHKLIEKNHLKPCLTNEELKLLENWMIKKGYKL